MKKTICKKLTMDSRLQNYPSAKYIEVDFGEVEVGVTKTKSIKIVNQCSIQQLYAVQKDVMSNPLDSVFHINEYNWSLDPHDSYICDISYRPILPNRKYVDYFFITDAYKCCYEILVRGTSLGPNVTISTTRLILICDKETCTKQESLTLKNHSNFPAEFTFDIDTAQCPFKVREFSGVIKASSSKCISISFESPDVGIHRYQLACLVLNQDPLILELFGICGCDMDKKYIQSIKSKIEDLENLNIENNFKNYMSDVTTAVITDPPLFSLSTCCIDFCYAEIGIENIGKRAPHTTSLTNHTNFSVFVKWDKDISEVFSIQPQEAKIRANKSAIFEIRFDPNEKETFYSRQLVARIFRLPCCPTIFESCDDLQRTVIPDILTIRLIGHTWSNINLLTQYEVPEAVTMPACSPTSATYTTFAIRSFGKQPLMFSLSPPAGSRYSLKPSLGLISRGQERQIIVVQLFAESPSEHEYVERWACRLNGCPDNELCLDLRGVSERPNLCFGRENSFGFQPVHIGCWESRIISVRNPTRHPVRFEFLSNNIPKELHIKNMDGIIDPNDTVFYDWTFTPDQLQHYNLFAICNVSTENEKKKFDIEIEITGSGMEGCLILIPEELNFGLLKYKESKDLTFSIFNFSPVKIHYLLSCQAIKSLETSSDCQNDIIISPIHGSLCPGKSSKCQIAVLPSQPGYHEMVIKYFTRSCESEMNPNHLIEPKDLCKVYYTCYLPVLQVKDLLYRVDSSKNISKISLWKHLNIDNLNFTLKELLPNEKASVEMTVPFDNLNEGEKLIIKLLLANVHPIEANYTFKKKKTCLCNDEKVKRRPLARSKLKNECPACVLDNSCSISPMNIKLLPQETCILSIDVTKNPLLSSGVRWDLNIGQGRQIILTLKLASSIIASGDFLKFKNIFVGQCMNMHYQAMWLYNNTENEKTYSVDVRNLVNFNKKNYSIIFTCLNKKGTIGPLERKAVLFGFCPNKIGLFQVTVPVKVNDDESELTIEAESTCTPTPFAISQESCPSSDIFSTPDVIVYFNYHYMTMPPLITYAKATRLILVHNHNSLDVLEYNWQNYEIPEVISVKIEPSHGLIQPQSLLTFLVKIVAGKYACSIDVDIFCNFTDASERRLAAKKKLEQDKKNEMLKNEFTITEKGISYPKISDDEKIPKPSTFSKTLTLKINIYDPREVDERMELEQHLKTAPAGGYMAEMIPQPDTYSPNKIQIFSQIIQSVMWDIMNSNSFNQILNNDLRNAHHLKYSQLPANIIDRERECKRSNILLPKEYTNDILHTMINMIIHEEFNLGTDHFTHPTDVRQISYQKVYSEVFTQRTKIRKSFT